MGDFELEITVDEFDDEGSVQRKKPPQTRKCLPKTPTTKDHGCTLHCHNNTEVCAW